MIEPCLADDRFLADVTAMEADAAHVHLWWLGQSGYLVQWLQHRLLLDPYLSDSLTRKYAGTDKPHVRLTGRVIAPERLPTVSLATSSHNHTDHLDAETLRPLLDANPELQIVVPAANQEFAAERLRVPPARLNTLDDGQTGRFGAFTLHAVPAAHETVERDELGRCRFLGYVVEVQGVLLYHSGDTVRFPGDVDRLRRWPMDVALLPINGRLPERRVTGNLWGHEAAELAFQSGARLVIPNHYEMFEFNSVSPDQFVTTCRRLGQAYQLLGVGERLSIPVSPRSRSPVPSS